MTRDFCKEFYFPKTELKKATKLNWFEWVALKFIKPTVHVDQLECITTVFKRFRNKIYIVRQFTSPPQHFNCRHQTLPFLKHFSNLESKADFKKRQDQIGNETDWVFLMSCLLGFVCGLVITFLMFIAAANGGR